SSHERSAQRDCGRKMRVCSAPSGDPVVVAFDFDSVPMDGGRLAQLVHDFNFYWLTARQHDGRANQAWFGSGRRFSVTAQPERIAGRPFAFADFKLKLAF